MNRLSLASAQRYHRHPDGLAVLNKAVDYRDARGRSSRDQRRKARAGKAA
jgi:hypothetical protein